MERHTKMTQFAKYSEADCDGVNVLLEGPAGTGKTYAIGTLVELGLEVFYLALEPGLESLLAFWADKGKPIPPNLHWHKMAAPKASFADLAESAKKVNTLTYDALTKIPDPNRGKHNQYVSMLENLANFHDQRTGQAFGSVDSWGADRVIVIDGMTGMGLASMAMVIGGKPVRSQTDWGMAQDQLERTLRMLADGCKCHFILLAHVERETDQVLGGVKLMTSTLGKALAPKIPAMFSDVILTVRTGDKWTWDTSSPMADLKTRNLPIGANLPADFKPIIMKWCSRMDAALAVNAVPVAAAQ